MSTSPTVQVRKPSARKVRPGDTHTAGRTPFEKLADDLADRAAVALEAKQSLVTIRKLLLALRPRLKGYPDIAAVLREEVLSLVWSGGDTPGRARYQIPKDVQEQAAENARQVILDRLWVAVEADAIGIDWEHRATPEVSILLTDGELAFFLSKLFPELYPDGPKPLPIPVNAPPGSPAKLLAMRTRLERGEELHSPVDPQMVGTNGQQARVVLNGNHTGQTVEGWDGDEEKDED